MSGEEIQALKQSNTDKLSIITEKLNQLETGEFKADLDSSEYTQLKAEQNQRKEVTEIINKIAELSNEDRKFNEEVTVEEINKYKRDRQLSFESIGTDIINILSDYELPAVEIVDSLLVMFTTVVDLSKDADRVGADYIKQNTEFERLKTIKRIIK